MIASNPVEKLGPRRTAGPEPVEVVRDAAPSALAVRLLAPRVAAVGIASALATLAWVALAPASAERAALVPLLVGMVLVGLPHGALDHLVPVRLGAAWARRPFGMALFLAGYVALAGAYLLLWPVAPAAAFVGFLLATVAHWGQGDVDFLERFLGRRRAGPFAHAAAIVLRGGLPVAVPVLVQTEVAEGLFAAAAGAFGAGAGSLDLGGPGVRWALGTMLAVAALGYAFGLRRAWPSWTGRAVDVGEVALLVALFAWVPAYLAIGTYFLAWHSLRHLGRLLLLRDADVGALAAGDLRGPAGRLARDLTPVTLVALAFLAGLTAWAAPRIAGLEGFVALYLVWISALTMPHLAVVAWMDGRGGPPRAAAQVRDRA